MIPPPFLFFRFYPSVLLVGMHFCVSIATVMVSLANLEGEESFEPALLGTAETVVQQRVCDDELILIQR